MCVSRGARRDPCRGLAQEATDLSRYKWHKRHLVCLGILRHSVRGVVFQRNLRRAPSDPKMCIELIFKYILLCEQIIQSKFKAWHDKEETKNNECLSRLSLTRNPFIATFKKSFVIIRECLYVIIVALSWLILIHHDRVLMEEKLRVSLGRLFIARKYFFAASKFNHSKCKYLRDVKKCPPLTLLNEFFFVEQIFSSNISNYYVNTYG